MCIAVYKGSWMSRLMCTYTLALSLFMFLAACLSYGVLHYLQKFNLTFSHKMCSNSYFSPSWSVPVAMNLNYFYKPKLAKTLLIFLKQSLRFTFYFIVIPYFEKILCDIAQGIIIPLGIQSLLDAHVIDNAIPLVIS